MGDGNPQRSGEQLVGVGPRSGRWSCWEVLELQRDVSGLKAAGPAKKTALCTTAGGAIQWEQNDLELCSSVQWPSLWFIPEVGHRVSSLGMAYCKSWLRRRMNAIPWGWYQPSSGRVAVLGVVLKTTVIWSTNIVLSLGFYTKQVPTVLFAKLMN